MINVMTTQNFAFKDTQLDVHRSQRDYVLAAVEATGRQVKWEPATSALRVSVVASEMSDDLDFEDPEVWFVTAFSRDDAQAIQMQLNLQ